MDDNLQVTPEQKPKFSLKNFLKTLPAKIKVFWKTPPKDRYLNLKEIVCFGGSAFGVSTLVCIVSGLITATQISEQFGIDVIHGPYICLIASVLGLIIQPLFGKLLQNTNTKWGKYKPYILFMAPVFAAFAIAATWSPDFIQDLAFNHPSKIIYAYCICTPTLILWNLFNNTFYMMPSVVTPNQQERTDIWAPIGLVIGFSPTLMNFLNGWVRGFFINDTYINDLGEVVSREYLAYRYMGLVYAVFGLLLVMLLLKVKERIIVTNENTEKVGLFEGLRMIVKNKPLMIFSLALICGCLRTTIEIDASVMGKLRYASTIDQGWAIFSSLSLITGFAVTPNMILLPLMTRKMNSKHILMIWSGCNVVGYLILACIGIANIPQGWQSAFAITLLRYIALFNAIASLQPLMMGQMSDYQQLKTGKRLEGYMQTFAYVLVLVATNIGYVVIAYVKQGMGYQPANYYNVQTVSDELMTIATDYFDLALCVSAISAALMFIVICFYPLGKKEHAQIVAALEQKSREEGKYTLDEEVGKASINAINEEEAAVIMGVAAYHGSTDSVSENEETVTDTTGVTAETKENQETPTATASDDPEDQKD